MFKVDRPYVPDRLDEEDDTPGRIRNDAEFTREIAVREDIFHLDHQRRFRIVVSIALVAGGIAGAIMTSMREAKAPQDFFSHGPQNRAVKLVSARMLPAIPFAAGSNALTSGPESIVFRPQPSTLEKSRFGLSGLHGQVPSSSAHRPVSGKSLPPLGAEYPLGTNQTARVQPKTFNNGKAATVEEAFDVRRGDSLKVIDHESAIAAFRRALALNPRNEAALAGIGNVYLFTGELDSAGKLFHAALAINPRDARVRNSLGSVHYYSSDLAANPRYTDFMKIRDPAQFIKSQYDSAITEYTNAITLDSSLVSALTNRGVVYELHHDIPAAIADYSRAIARNPSYAEAYARRAATYKSLGRFTDAHNDYTTAIALGPSSYPFDPTLHFANAYFGRGMVDYQMGKLPQAVEDYDSALALSPNHPLAIIDKALALGDMGKYDSAIACYSRAIAVLSPMEYNGAQEHAYFGRGLMYNLTSRFDLALKDFDAALRLMPDDRFADLHRGNAYKALGKYDSAVADYRKAMALPRLAAKSCWRTAECYSLKGDREDAVSWLKEAISRGFADFAAWKKDTDLSILRTDAEFISLTASKQRPRR